MGKKQNQGFTLVEVIVSIAILALIVAPFINAFVVSQKNSANAKANQTITSYSESLMEKFKAQSFDSLTAEFPLIDTALIDSYEGKNFSYYDSANNEYVFNVNSEKITGKANGQFSAEVKMTPRTYDAPALSDVSGDNAAILISEVYRNDDAAVSSLYSMLSEVNDVAKSYDYKSTNGLLSTNIQNGIQRVTHVYITYNASGGTRPFMVSVDMEYQLNYGTGILTQTYSDIFENSYEVVPDVMLFYTMYPYGTSSSSNDKILIDNQLPDDIISSSDKKANVYISNQQVALKTGKKLRFTSDSLSNIVFENAGTSTTPVAITSGGFENANTKAYMSNEIYDDTLVNQINTLVGTKETVKLYDIKVDLRFGGKSRAVLTSSTEQVN